MKKTILLALNIFFIISCANDRETVKQLNKDEKTPEALNDERSLDISSLTKRTRYSTDIIQELFDEAIENDKDLKNVTSALEKARELKSDSLESYKIYMRNNQNYWGEMLKYSSQLSDSTMRKDLLRFVEVLKEKQDKRTLLLDKLVADIDSTEKALDNMEILMKIIVTEPMMNNYQRNELPRAQTLESVKHALGNSIEAVEPYTKIQK